MNKLFSHVLVILSAVMFSVLIILNGCSTPDHEGFAVYLTRDDIAPTKMPVLNHVEIAEQPVFSTKDIVTYNAQTHEVKLTIDAYERISKLDVPVNGRSFMVCVDKRLVYFGAFWTPVSSISFDGVTIWKPYNSEGPEIITLELGYPSSSFYGGEDPRTNPEILASLKQAGKLIDKLSIETVSELPRSMKGYELYSWPEDNQWHFTLITGTNRNKTPEEIVSHEDYISETGWVKVHVAGVDALKMALAKLPRGEFVCWLDGVRLTTQSDTNITLPPVSVTGSVKVYAAELGLDFLVAQP